MTTTPPPSATRLSIALLVLTLVLQMLVLYLPRVPEVGGIGVPGLDKVGHLAVFAAVTVTALGAGLRRRVVIGVGLVHAVLSEVLQHTLLPNRSGDPLDVVADVLGVWVGVAVARRLGVATPQGRRART